MVQEQVEPRATYLMDSSGEIPNRTAVNNAAYSMDFEAMGQLLGQENQRLMPHSYNQGNSPGGFRAFNAPTQFFDTSMPDLGLVGPQSELVGWAELDACVSCLI
jgi:hypothetical protein